MAAPSTDPDDLRHHRFRHHPLLGTVVEVRVDGTSDVDLAGTIDQIVVAEMTRLQAVFSAFDPSSELARWKRGEVTRPSAEFVELLTSALDWQRRSSGAYNPAVGLISDAWADAARTGVVPGDGVLGELADSIREPRYELDGEGRPVPTGDCSPLNFNAFAKGWIVDRALMLGALDRRERDVAGLDVTVNAGGDLAHRGPNGLGVGIENPFRPYDNEPPIATVTLTNGGLATSGRARRGFRVAGRWFGHVIDPRNGRTVDDIASISVIAPTAAEADVIATIAGVRSPADAVAFCTERGVPCLVVAADHERFDNAGWREVSQA